MININSVRQMESFMEKAITINRDSKSIYDLNICGFIFRRQSLSTLGFGNMKMLNIVGGKGTESCNIRFVYNATLIMLLVENLQGLTTDSGKLPQIFLGTRKNFMFGKSLTGQIQIILKKDQL